MLMDFQVGIRFPRRPLQHDLGTMREPRRCDGLYEKVMKNWTLTA